MTIQTDLKSISSLTIEQLEDRKQSLELAIARIKEQLYEAKYTAASTGVYADPLWYGNAQFALRAHGREHQAVLTELAKKRKALRAVKHLSREELFIKIARRNIARDVYFDIWRQVEEELANGNK